MGEESQETSKERCWSCGSSNYNGKEGCCDECGYEAPPILVKRPNEILPFCSGQSYREQTTITISKTSFGFDGVQHPAGSIIHLKSNGDRIIDYPNGQVFAKCCQCQKYDRWKSRQDWISGTAICWNCIESGGQLLY